MNYSNKKDNVLKRHQFALGRVLKECAFCNKKLEKAHYCKACKETPYCNADCQKKDWKTNHRAMCRLMHAYNEPQARLLLTNYIQIDPSFRNNILAMASLSKKDERKIYGYFIRFVNLADILDCLRKNKVFIQSMSNLPKDVPLESVSENNVLVVFEVYNPRKRLRNGNDCYSRTAISLPLQTYDFPMPIEQRSRAIRDLVADAKKYAARK
jgi:MYND finger